MAAMIIIDLLLVIATFQYVNRKCYVDCFTMVAGVGYEYQIALVVACAFLTYHQFCVTLVHWGWTSLSGRRMAISSTSWAPRSGTIDHMCSSSGSTAEGMRMCVCQGECALELREVIYVSSFAPCVTTGSVHGSVYLSFHGYSIRMGRQGTRRDDDEYGYDALDGG